MWKKCLDCIDELLDILFDNNNNIFIGENIAEDSENLNAAEQVSSLVPLLFVCFVVFWSFPELKSCSCVFVLFLLYRLL